MQSLSILANLASMVWVIWRILMPFVAGSVFSTMLLLVWSTLGGAREVSAALYDLPVGVLFVMPFQAVGSVLLVPIALLLCHLSLPKPAYPMLLAVVGAAVGMMIVLPIADRPTLLDLTLPAICGALSAVVWLAFNWDAVKRRT